MSTSTMCATNLVIAFDYLRSAIVSRLSLEAGASGDIQATGPAWRQDDSPNTS
jgi:hypothetical protein